MTRSSYPPGPRGPFSALSFFAGRHNPPEHLIRLSQRHGPVVHLRMANRHVYFINEPELIREVLVLRNSSFVKGPGLQRTADLLGSGLLTSEGELHRRQRQLAQPAFRHERIEAYAEAMVAATQSATSGWRDGEEIDIAAATTHLTLDIVGRTLFGFSVAADADEIRSSVSTLVELFRRLVGPLGPLRKRLPLPSTLKASRAIASLDRIIYRLIEERRLSGERREDLLSMLMDAVDEDGRVMEDRQLRDEVMTLILAGFETTTNALTWTWQLLGEHPFIAEKLRDEIDNELGGRLPRAADLHRLRLTDMILTESMRLYPPAWVIGRMATKDVTIGPWRIPPKSIVFLSPYAMHRDPRFYEDPLAFNPWRWEEPARSRRPKFAYFPFGGGPRVCIGEGFARMEAVLLLAAISQQWRLRPLGPMPHLKAAITLRPEGRVMMRLESRGPMRERVAASG